ncbi:hypothetical protein PGTUg99_024828 [Puccinia graminis f. sp. tritici]|uniref:Uncharacterized protein n=2 Tax=Puccinia graminis f. sp. tritici TaxID=56615 RepID=A0A5B0S6M9_PUCGR|nr:hypothetical protein PGTUg99_024828 [Puccinia graminis f. sp. tritici]
MPDSRSSWAIACSVFLAPWPSYGRVGSACATVNRTELSLLTSDRMINGCRVSLPDELHERPITPLTRGTTQSDKTIPPIVVDSARAGVIRVSLVTMPIEL